MPVDFYYASLSSPCRVVDIIAKELGLIDLNIIHMDLLKKEYLKEEFVKLNPLHVVPTINDNGFILWESHVTITYFCNKYGSSKHEHLYPKDPQKRAAIDKLLYFSNGVFFQRFLEYLIPKWGLSSDDFKIGEDKLHVCLLFLEQVLQNSVFLTDEKYTLADICFAVYITILEAIDFGLSAYPKLLKMAVHCKIKCCKL